jgi:hypothetical protein
MRRFMKLAPHKIRILRLLSDGESHLIRPSGFGRRVWECPHQYGYRSISAQGLGMKASCELRKLREEGFVKTVGHEDIYDYYRITEKGKLALKEALEGEVKK